MKWCSELNLFIQSDVESVSAYKVCLADLNVGVIVPYIRKEIKKKKSLTAYAGKVVCSSANFKYPTSKTAILGRCVRIFIVRS